MLDVDLVKYQDVQGNGRIGSEDANSAMRCLH
jgi:hypothetical protein